MIERVQELIKLLENIEKRPRMFFPLTKEGVETYLRGFYHGAHDVVRNTSIYEIYGRVQMARGWEWNAHLPSYEMRERGMSDAAIVDEMLIIEIEAWKRVLAELQERK